MSAPLSGQKSWSPVDLILQWYRDWTRRTSASELKCFGEEEVERMAKDVGVSASELRTVARCGPEAADLLLRRMARLDLARNEVAQTEPATFQDLQRVCTMCESHRRCARDFARDSADPDWKDYCPNAATLIALSALPWRRGVSGSQPYAGAQKIASQRCFANPNTQCACCRLGSERNQRL